MRNEIQTFLSLSSFPSPPGGLPPKLDAWLPYRELSQMFAAQLPQSVGAHHYFCELGAVAVLAGLKLRDAISRLIK